VIGHVAWCTHVLDTEPSTALARAPPLSAADHQQLGANRLAEQDLGRVADEQLRLERHAARLGDTSGVGKDLAGIVLCLAGVGLAEGVGGRAVLKIGVDYDTDTTSQPRLLQRPRQRPMRRRYVGLLSTSAILALS